MHLRILAAIGAAMLLSAVAIITIDKAFAEAAATALAHEDCGRC